MNLTTEQIEQILDGAFDEELGEFTIVVRNRLHKRDGKGWLSKRLDGTGLTNKLQPNTKNVQNISDLREILTLRQRVAELEAQVPKWISVEDRLPPVGQECLFFRPLAENSGDEPIAVKVARVDHGQCWESTVPHGFKPCNPSDGYCHVTHWMPLPTPPKMRKKRRKI